jgi:hypothetical protein
MIGIAMIGNDVALHRYVDAMILYVCLARGRAIDEMFWSL